MHRTLLLLALLTLTPSITHAQSIHMGLELDALTAFAKTHRPPGTNPILSSFGPSIKLRLGVNLLHETSPWLLILEGQAMIGQITANTDYGPPQPPYMFVDDFLLDEPISGPNLDKYRLIYLTTGLRVGHKLSDLPLIPYLYANLGVGSMVAETASSHSVSDEPVFTFATGAALNVILSQRIHAGIHSSLRVITRIDRDTVRWIDPGIHVELWF